MIISRTTKSYDGIKDLQEPSLFGSINVSIVVYLSFMAIITPILFLFSTSSITAMFILASICITAFRDPFLCLGTYIVISKYASQVLVSDIAVALLGVVCLSFIFHNLSMLRMFQYCIFLVCSASIIVLTYVCGIDSKLSTTLLVLLVLVSSVSMLNYQGIIQKNDISTCACAYFSCALSIALFFILASVKGINIIMFNRLSFFGDIKPITFMEFIPLLFIVTSRIEGKRCFSNINLPVLEILISLICLIVIIFTAARGMIWAGILAIAYQLIVSRNKKRVILYIVPFLLILMLAVFLSMESNQFEIGRIFDFSNDEYSNMNGRTEIWKEYMELMLNNGVFRFLMGYGAGDSGRLITSGHYAHSSYIDCLICFGVIGFILLCVCEIKIFARFCRKKRTAFQTIFLFSVIAESTHGSIANYMLFTLHVFLLLADCSISTKEEESK